MRKVVLLVVFLGLAYPPAPSAAARPLPQGLQRSGRSFTYNGQYVYFVGVDGQQLAADPALDYVNILDQFRVYRINKVRIWLDVWFGGSRVLRPWAYDAGAGRYDLDSWDPNFWQRMKDFLAAAQARDIVIEISLFSAYPSDPGWWSDPTWKQAWNKNFNKNGAFSANASGHFFPEFWQIGAGGMPLYGERSTSGKTILDYQQALVDKTLAELGGYTNLYFEVCNEFFEFASSLPGGYDVYPWEQYWAAYLRARTPLLVTCHVHDATAGNVNGVQYFWDRSDVDVLNYHLYDTSPGGISSQLHTSQVKGQILQCNESFEWYTGTSVDMGKVDQVTREAWGWFLSGGYYAFYNGQHVEYGGWGQFAVRAKVLHDLADTVQFWRMSPIDNSGSEVDGLVSQGPAGSNWQVLADRGSEYVAYFWGSTSSTSVRIQLASGNYDYAWYDPRDGALLSSGAVTGGGTATVPAPPTSWSGTVGVALFIRSSAPPPRGPYGGTPWAIPGRIEAENFDEGGEGVAYHDLDTTNNGGQYRSTGVDIESTTDAGGGYGVGWIQSGEWLEYTVNVASPGTYTIGARVASNGGGGTFHIEFGGVDKTAAMTIPDTGGWDTWQTISVSGVSLSAGQQVMRISMDSNGATGWVGNINYVSIGMVSVNQPPSVSITSPAAGATFTAPATITITASASDTDGTVAKVEFFQGATLLGTDTAAPYSFTWNNVSAGSYTLTAKATDNLGAATTSSPVGITVGGSAGTGTGLMGQYYDNIDFTALKVTRTDPTVDFDWGNGSPDPSIGADTFSVRWTGQVQAQFSETYTFYAVSDDGVRLWVNGQLLIDEWIDQSPTEWSGTIALVAGQKYDLKMEYYENGGGAVARLLWSSPSTPKQVIPQSQLYPAAPGNQAPSVSITSPANGATFTAPATVTISANASDSDGTIAKVEFFANGTLLGTDTTAPYSFPWNSVSSGSYTLTAKATDNAGATTTSSPVSISVTTGTTDTDGDGMPDAWEIQYGLNPHDPSDASGDPDGDGYTNLQEYQGGSDPRNPGSVPGLAVTIDSVSTGKPYSLATAKVGQLYYIDRSYKISSVSAALSGQVLIRTANDDRNVTAGVHLKFTVSAAATVYVGYDKRASQVPGWLNDGTWTLTGETLAVTDGGASPMRVYQKGVGAGQVVLGGNKASPASGAKSDYVVVVRR